MENRGSGGGCLWPILQRQAESPKVFKTHNQIKQVIHSQNKQYAMLLGVLDLERDTGTIEVERNKQRNGGSVKSKQYGSKELLILLIHSLLI